LSIKFQHILKDKIIFLSRGIICGIVKQIERENMKTTITIFFFLLQAWFISASAMKEIQSPVDSTSKEKCLIVLSCKAEYLGKILSQNDDTLKFLSDKGWNITVPIKFVSCIVKYFDNYTPDLVYDISSEKRLRIISEVGHYSKIKYDNDSAGLIDQNNTLEFPFYKIENVQIYNKELDSLYKIYVFGVKDSIIGKIISSNSDSIKVITQSNFLLNFPKEYISWLIPATSCFNDTIESINPSFPLEFVNDYTNNIVQLSCMSDSSKLGTPTKRILMNDGHEISGKILYEHKDSVIIKVDSGVSAIVRKSGIDDIYDYNYYAKNILYIDLATVLLSGYCNISYERLFTNFISMRVGYGYGYLVHSIADGPTTNGQTLCLLVNFLCFEGNSKLEFGMGATYLMEEEVFGPPKYKLGYAFSCNYRYQPKYGGFIFKTGMSLLYPGFGFNFAIGHAF
jgi:hypothetical protein